MPKLALVARKPEAGTALQRLIEEFLQAPTKTGETRSRKTGLIYRDALEGVLLPYCSRAGVTEPAQLTDRHMKELTEGLLDGTGSRSGRPLAKPTVHSYVRAINTFLAWVKNSGEAIGAKAYRPKLERRILAVLTRKEIEAMENAAALERDKLIVRTLADFRHPSRRAAEAGQRRHSRRGPTPLPPGAGERQSGPEGAHRTSTRSAAEALRAAHPPRVREHEALPRQQAQRSDWRLRGAHPIRHPADDPTPGARRRHHQTRLPPLVPAQLHYLAARGRTNPILLSRIVGHESLTMINQVYAHVTMDTAYDALMRSLLGSED